MSQIPFDLQRALAGDAVVTRDGRPWKFGSYNHNAIDKYRVAGWLFDEGGFWDERGRYYGLLIDHGNDIFMAPKKRTVYIKRDPESSGYLCFNDERSAQLFNPSAKIYPFEVEE